MDYEGLPLTDVLQSLKRQKRDVCVECINENCGDDCIERVVRVKQIDDKIILTSAYFKNNAKEK